MRRWAFDASMCRAHPLTGFGPTHLIFLTSCLYHENAPQLFFDPGCRPGESYATNWWAGLDLTPLLAWSFWQTASPLVTWRLKNPCFRFEIRYHTSTDESSCSRLKVSNLDPFGRYTKGILVYSRPLSDYPVHPGVDTQVQARIPLGCDESCVCVHPGTVCRLADPWVAILEPRPQVMFGSGVGRMSWISIGFRSRSCTFSL